MKRGTFIAGKRSKGFTYVAALAALVVLGITAQSAMTVGSTEALREKEIELLFRGVAYQEAIRSYYLAANPHRFPSSLEDLLQDPRFLHKRHLRHLYVEPMSGEWRLVRDARGGIMGVASSSERVPLKHFDFPSGLDHFSEAESYRDWAFLYDPRAGIPH